ncbi:hypothetical protein OJ997_01310 [Solirubrobacter phytolaccae]|uniref:Bacterial repeat domain-containing protein n=1 Tax=Solirubrobacter phytolaccae TaxID=1404360 RepID=A0A9X3N335_9ACTN|nr:hypothetical protein [Solirubrobacter phytolaccae]MDA0178915.1 hypothetical protein [Solirubrobacter phytolaccae]
MIKSPLRWTPLLALLLTLVAPTFAVAGPPGLQWSAPKQINGAAPFSGGHRIDGMSCPTTSLCVGVDAEGRALTATSPAAGTWTPTPISDSEGLLGIDCASATRCVAITRWGEVITTSNPTGGAGAWATAKVADGTFLGGVSCPTTTFCAAVGSGGLIVTSTNPTGSAGAWTKTNVPGVDLLWKISCPTASLCVAIDAGNNLLTSTNPTGGASAWQRTTIAGTTLSDVSCPSTTLCVAVGYAGKLFTSTNPTGGAGAWTTSTFETQSIGEIDCPTTTFCAATVGWANKVITTTNPAGGAAAWSGTDVGTFAGVVGCASAALCVAGDDSGNAYISTGGAWAKSQISGTNSLNAVDCLPSGFCAATDEAGRVLTATNPTGTWTAQTVAAGRNLTDIDCPTASLCFAVDTTGNLVWSTTPTGAAAWTVTNIDLTRSLTAISCPTASFCAAIDNQGYVVTSTNPTGGTAAWSRFGLAPLGTEMGSVSCASASLCIVSDRYYGRLWTSANPAGGAWTLFQTPLVDGFRRGVVGLSCTSATFCAALDTDGRIHTATDPGTKPLAWDTITIPVSGLSIPTNLTCLSSTFCVGVDAAALAYSSTQPGDPSAWAVRPADSPGHDLVDVSCVSTALCVAINSIGMMTTGSPAPNRTLTVAKSGSGTVTSAPGGISCGATCSASFTDGAVVTLTATAAAGSRFSGWSGACTGTGSCEVELLEARSVTATFVPTAALTVAKAGAGSGTITSAPAGIDCGTTCSFTYDEGTKVTLTATAAAGSGFTGWSGGCTGTGPCEVTLTAAKTVTATFARHRTLRVDTWNGGWGYGRVTSPAGVDCDSVCDYAKADGTTLTLTATADPGSRFAGWSGGGCTGTGTCTVTLTADTTVVAAFNLTHTLTVAKAGTGVGTVVSAAPGITCGTTCSAVYDEGTSVTLTATPAAGSTFAGWSGGGCSGTRPCTTRVDDSDTVTATFTVDPVPTATPTPTPTPTATATPTPSATATPTPTLEPTPPPSVQPGPTPAPTPIAAAPDTRLGKKSVKQRTATFRFTAVGKSTGFRCALTARGKKVVYKACKSPVTFKQLKPGKYTFRVATIGDPTPATTTITVKKGR